MTGSILLAIGGVVVLTGIQVWAYSASPSWVAKRNAGGKAPPGVIGKGVFRRRLFIYYAAILIFATGWLVHALFLMHRATELQRLIDSMPGR
ncbi:MAG: hypothetical protein ABSF69_30310 [Polyangiaceae bacterium]|jgi:hypothetical protein